MHVRRGVPCQAVADMHMDMGTRKMDMHTEYHFDLRLDLHLRVCLYLRLCLKVVVGMNMDMGMDTDSNAMNKGMDVKMGEMDQSVKWGVEMK